MEINQKKNGMPALLRATHFEQLQNETYDLLIIGGGVTGCGIALDAAARGLKTALIEKSDFGSGTSSKSTKLIHGGLRYLKQLEIGLVRETGRERAIVHRLAPHLVLPEKMLLPIIKGGTFGKWTAALAITVYDFLASVEQEDRMEILSKEEALNKEPLLDESVLKNGIFYAEYRTDDARLTIELAKTAQRKSALLVNYCEGLRFIYDNKKLEAVACKDMLTGKTFNIKATQVVSAGGAWVDEIRTKDKSMNNKRLHHTKGVHLVFPHDKFPLQHSVYFDVPDGRMIFAIPRGRATYVGTTDTTYHGSLNKVLTTQADVQYILNAVEHAFPTIDLNEDDVISSWAGLRPLIHEEGKSPSELSRKDEIFKSDTGLISIAGGKLTGYRKMAERVVDLVTEKIKGSFSESNTKAIPLAEQPFADSRAVNQYIDQLTKKTTVFGLEPYHTWYLTTTYGKAAERIIDKLKSFDEEPEVALARAEAWYTVHYEMVQRLEDFFVRRTGQLYFDILNISKVRQAVATDLQNYLGWDENTLQAEQDRLSELIHDATHFYKQEQPRNDKQKD